MEILDIPKHLIDYLKSKNLNEFHRLKLKSSKFRYVINVPADGWCLLYSFQCGYYSAKEEFLSIEYIRNGLLNSFDDFCSMQTNLEFLAINEADDMNKSAKNLLKSRGNPNNMIDICRYYLIKYLLNKHFNNGLVDIIPKLLASFFKCRVNIYVIEDRFFVLKDNYSFNPNNLNENNRKADKSELPIINLLFLSDIKHYLSFSQLKLSKIFFTKVNTEVAMLNENRSKFLEDLKNNKTFARVAKSFEIVSQLLNLRPRPTIYKFSKFAKQKQLLITNELKQNSVSLNEYLSKKLEKHYSELANRDDVDKYEAINKNKTNSSIQISERESLYISSLLARFIDELSQNKDIEKKNRKPIEIFLEKLLKACSTNGLYVELNILWLSIIDKQAYYLKVPPKHILVDCNLTQLEVIVFWSHQLNRYQLTIEKNFKSLITKFLNEEEYSLIDFKNGPNYRSIAPSSHITLSIDEETSTKTSKESNLKKILASTASSYLLYGAIVLISVLTFVVTFDTFVLKKLRVSKKS